MKIFIVVLAFAAVAVNAQSRTDPYANYFSKNYNRPQISQPKYQPYRPYQTTTTTRRPYIPLVTTSAPSTLPPYIAPTFVAPTSKYYNDDARLANTVKSGNEIDPDGSYNWFFETDHGIAAQAQGTPRNLGGNPPQVAEVVQGAFSWVAPNGELIDFTYTADENGYHPKSDAIPTPPPIPPQIARALEYLSRTVPTQK